MLQVFQGIFRLLMNYFFEDCRDNREVNRYIVKKSLGYNLAGELGVLQKFFTLYTDWVEKEEFVVYLFKYS